MLLLIGVWTNASLTNGFARLAPQVDTTCEKNGKKTFKAKHPASINTPATTLRTKGKPMAVPIKISTDRRLATDECCTKGHADCDYHAPEWCWVNKIDANDCLCRMLNPSAPNGAQYKKWEDPKPTPTAPPAEMEMMTNMQMLASPAPTSNLYKMCYTKCGKDQVPYFNKGGYNLPKYFACLNDCARDEAIRQGSGLPPL